jgi:hypothetical protein
VQFVPIVEVDIFQETAVVRLGTKNGNFHLVPPLIFVESIVA